MRKWKKWIAVCATAVLAAGLAACGGSDDGGSASASAAAESSAEAVDSTADDGGAAEESTDAEAPAASEEAADAEEEKSVNEVSNAEGMTYVTTPQEKLDAIRNGEVDPEFLLSYDTSQYTNFDLKEIKVGVSLGYYREGSGAATQRSYQETLAALGIPESNITLVQTDYDPVEQTEQINALVQQEPDILFLSVSDPDGITQAVQNAMDAGIPTFVIERVNNVEVTQNICLDDYSAGYAIMEALIKNLDGKGNIGMFELDSNAAWNVRGVAAKDLLAENPDINVVSQWSWDSTGVVTPRNAMDSFLTQNSEEGSLDAVWSAWDNAVIEAITACREVGREEIKFVGIDGTPQALSLMLESDQWIFDYSHCFYDLARTSVLNGMAYLNGEAVNPKWNYTGYGLNRDEVVAASESLPEGIDLSEGDRLYLYEALGFQRATHYDFDWDTYIASV